MLLRILVILLMISSQCFAQKVRLLQGDLKPLKGQKSIQIEFEFDSTLIGGVTPEAEYIANKKICGSKRSREKVRTLKLCGLTVVRKCMSPHLPSGFRKQRTGLRRTLSRPSR
jgi:hypothetical protein